MISGNANWHVSSITLVLLNFAAIEALRRAEACALLWFVAMPSDKVLEDVSVDSTDWGVAAVDCPPGVDSKTAFNRLPRLPNCGADDAPDASVDMDPESCPRLCTMTDKFVILVVPCGCTPSRTSFTKLAAAVITLYVPSR